MASVDGAHRVGAAVFRRMQVGDQVTNGRSHDQQIAPTFLTRVPLTLPTPKGGRFSVWAELLAGCPPELLRG